MRRPSITDKVRRAAKALKRLVDTGEITAHLVVDDDIRQRLSKDEQKDLDRLIEWEREMLAWLASDDTEQPAEGK